MKSSSRNFNLKLSEKESLTPIFLSTFGLGMAFGGYIPLIALWLESQNVSFSNIGLITGASSLGVILSACLGPRIVQKLDT